MSKLPIAIALTTACLSAVSYAQEDACLSPTARFDVCQYAREVQEGTASSLPMQLNANMVLERVAAIGPRVAFYAAWSASSADLETALLNARTSEKAIKEGMVTQTRTMVCGQETTAAFIRLGGEIQYLYRLSDGAPFMSVLVDRCS